jgi:predicted O-methyltransferase YrrM
MVAGDIVQLSGRKRRGAVTEQHTLMYLTEKGLQLDLGPQALSKLLARYELFKLISDLPGDIVECGVYRGASLFQWANFIELFAPHSQKTVIGFDTFKGFSTILSYDPDRESVSKLLSDKQKFVPRTVEELTSIASTLGLSHRLRLIEGDAVETIPKFVEDNRGLRLAMLHLDFDVYEPTFVSLTSLYPLLVPGGVLVMDQYGSSGWGESDAVDEFFRGQQVKFRRFQWSAGPAAFYIKATMGATI